MEEEIQQKYYQLQVLKKHSQEFEQQREMLNQKVAELFISLNAISNLESMKEGDALWAPIGSGAFVKTAVKDSKKVFIGVGADVIVRKPTGEALETIQKQLEQLTGLDKQVAHEISEINARIERLEPELAEMIEEYQKGQK